MALRPVTQESTTGCFVAGIATLLGVPYKAAYALLHPGKDPAMEYMHGFSDVSMLNAAFKALDRAGIKGRPSKFKKFATYRKRDQHALLIIRWEWSPTMCHTIVYDGDEHKFYDPSYGEVTSKYSLRSL